MVHPPPPSSIHLHPAAISSIYLHPAHFNLHPALTSSFQPPPSSLQHPQRYLCKSIFGQIWAEKVKGVCFPDNLHKWYLEDADSYFNISFLIFETKIHFWVNLGQKSQSCLSCLKIGTHGILRMWILIPTLVL